VNVLETRVCPACGSAKHHGLTVGDHPLRRCARCGLVYAVTYADPAEVYVEGYLFGETDFGPNLMFPLFQEFLAHAATLRLGAIEKVVGRRGSLLDVGCGTGELLTVAQSRGWDVQGIEPVAKSAGYARDTWDLPVETALLEQSALPQASFDVVTAFHVLEHMADAAGFLRTIARWVRPGGYVVVEVPNWSSFHRRNAGQGWDGLRPLEHIGYYGPRTLRATLRRAGIEPVRVRAPGFLWDKQTLQEQLNDLGLYRWGSRLHRLGRPGRRDGEDQWFPNRFGAPFLRLLQAGYSVTGVGQVVLAVARVPERPC
jgi:SAM-dependent methyltransferase